VRRGDVYVVDLRPTRGGAMRKARPGVVVSPDELNAHLRTFIVAPELVALEAGDETGLTPSMGHAGMCPVVGDHGAAAPRRLVPGIRALKGRLGVKRRVLKDARSSRAQRTVAPT